jgi:hypothetical protein
MSAKYELLDAAILSYLGLGARESWVICNATRTIAKPIAESESNTSSDAGLVDEQRIVSRRLQALRKDGRVRYQQASNRNPNGGWALRAQAAAIVLPPLPDPSRSRCAHRAQASGEPCERSFHAAEMEEYARLAVRLDRSRSAAAGQEVWETAPEVFS